MSSSKASLLYLDHAATTWEDPEVSRAVSETVARRLGNPASVHPAGVEAALEVERARARLAKSLGCTPEEIYFFGSGTEANNFAVRAFLRRAGGRTRLVMSAIEHSSLLNPGRALAEEGFTITLLPVNSQGRVPPEALREALGPDVALVSIAPGNNETGVLQDLPALAAVARAAGVPFHADACQTFGKTNFSARAVDLATVCGHKMHGPLGVAALYVRKGLEPAAQLQGGGQERGLRPGSLNVPGIVGFGLAAQLLRTEDQARMRALTERLEGSLRAAFPGMVVNSPAERLCHLFNFTLPGRDHRQLAQDLGKRGICVSNGSACKAGKAQESHVLRAMGRPEGQREAIRVSVSKWTTEAEIDALAAALGGALPMSEAIAESLDLRGIPCPENAAKALLAMELMMSGELIELLLDDGEPMRNVPASLEQNAHEEISRERRPEGHWRLVARVA